MPRTIDTPRVCLYSAIGREIRIQWAPNMERTDLNRQLPLRLLLSRYRDQFHTARETQE